MKTAYFGGAFDPFHIEHKNIILQAQAELGLDRVVVFPSATPPHKTCATDFAARSEMVKASLKDVPFVVVDSVENEMEGATPTVKVLPLLLEKYPADEAYLLIGGDSIVKFSTWVQPEKIAQMVKIAVVARDNKEEAFRAAEWAKENLHADVKVLRYVGEKVSSSVIKAKLETGETPEGIEEVVLDVIKKRNLYSDHVAMLEKLKSVMTEKRYEHVKRTTFYALKLNEKLGLNYEKVFIAGMLHDCAKHLDETMEGVPSAVVHQFTGAILAKEMFGINDEEILSAIRYHTTGKPAMTFLEKLIFTADMLEEGRTFPGVTGLRAIVEADFEKGFVACVNASLNELIEHKKPIHPLTKECALYYNKEEQNK